MVRTLIAVKVPRRGKASSRFAWMDAQHLQELLSWDVLHMFCQWNDPPCPR